jgi:hypothetical protein
MQGVERTQPVFADERQRARLDLARGRIDLPSPAPAPCGR